MSSFSSHIVVRNRELTTLQNWHDPHISILWKHDQIFDTPKDSWFLTNFTNLTNVTGLPLPLENWNLFPCLAWATEKAIAEAL